MKVLAIHGGAGTILKSKMTPEKERAYRLALEDALTIGYSKLGSGQSALDAVEAAVRSLEDSPLFNAGRGSVFSSLGKNEMDASIMDGASLEAGAVAGISGFKNPISLARQVMEKSDHVMLIGRGAGEFGENMGVETAEESYFYSQERYDQWLSVKDSDTFMLDHSVQDEKFGTVGAVALDDYGNLAAATSTGGMTNKKYGRVGDSPLIGCGTYANNNTCAVSCTGSGEYFIRGVVAYDVSCLMEMGGLTLKEASEKVIHERLLEINGDGGLIAIDPYGNVSMPFNTEGMYRGCIDKNGQRVVEIYRSTG